MCFLPENEQHNRPSWIEIVQYERNQASSDHHNNQRILGHRIEEKLEMLLQLESKR